MLLVLTGFVIIILADLIPLIRRRSGRGIAAFFLLFLPALTLAVLQAKGIEVPSIMLVLDNIAKALGLSY